MPTPLPPRPSLEHLKKQAKSLLKNHQAAQPEAFARIQNSHARWQELSQQQIAAAPFTLVDAQAVLAREHGFPSWATLLAHIQALASDGAAAALAASLREAAGKGDLARLDTLLAEHPELIDERGGEGVRTALHHAVFGNRQASVKLLLERGANPNIRCEGDNAFPLHFAVEKNRIPIIHLLVEHGADTIGEGDYHELGVIGWATAWEYIQPDPATVAYLLAHGAHHNIYSAVAMGDLAAIRAIIALRPTDLEQRMNGSIMRPMPLHLAVLKRQPAAVEALLDLGANTEALDEAGFTPLDQAALARLPEIVALLLNSGAKLRLPAATALGRHTETARLMHQEPDALKSQGRWSHLIVRAGEHGSAAMVETLLRYGADVNIIDSTNTSIDRTAGYTPLHGAAWYGNLAAIEVLLKHGADVNARESKWRATPAGWANYAGHKEACERILSGPIDILEAIQFDRIAKVVEVLDRDPTALDRTFAEYRLYPSNAEAWQTPLAYAIALGHVAIAQLLLKRGADATIHSPQDLSLRQIARSNGHVEIATILEMKEE